MSRVARGILAVGVAAALALGSNPATAADGPPEPNVPLSICSPDNSFTLTIDNPYFPLAVGQQSVFFGEEDDVPLGLRITVLDETKTFYKGKNKIVTRVVEEVEWADINVNGLVDDGEELIEVSRNYFAQVTTGERPGTVCYFGEDVKIYEDGSFRGDREGSWRADAKGNAPGVFMPSEPDVGEVFQSEAAPGVAADTAEVIGFGTVTIQGSPGTPYQNAMEVQDCNPLETDVPFPENCGTKFYAPGYGLIIDGDVVLTEFVGGTALAGKAKKR